MQIRLPVDEDWAAIRERVRKHHARTIFAHIPFSDTKYEVLEGRAKLPGPHQCLIVAELRGEIVGMAWFSAGEYILGDGGVRTTDI